MKGPHFTTKHGPRGNVNDHEAKEIVYEYSAFIIPVKRYAPGTPPALPRQAIVIVV